MPPPERPSLPVPVILAIVGGGLMLLGIGLVVVMSLVVYSAVRAREASPAPELAVPYAEVETVEAPLPARFAAPLPGPGAWTAFLNDDPRWPPYAHVRDRLCAGDTSVREGWLAAIRLHAKRGAPAERLAETYGQLGRWCGKEAHCRGVLDLLALGEAPAVRHALWQSLVSCSGEEVASRFGK
ncbi:MAG: hypothetical protein HYZ27_04630, partial [Deltaproteobacteria bacterium]|nr:hypothetical protein [Deltaproteobacteria bacterium]